jgi:biotin carboxyl carrier protein
MPDDPSIADRVRRLAAFLAESDAVRVRIERGQHEIELSRRPRTAPASGTQAKRDAATGAEAAPVRLETITADLVGIFRLGRPAPFEGELLDDDRELAFIEALGIRHPVHSLGGGRIVSIPVHDGAPVEYGQSLFLVDRR